MQSSVVELGGLECRILEAVPDGERPELVVVLCHGFGAPGTDLVGLAPEVLHIAPDLARRTRFLFPAGPLAPADLAMYGGRAWWPLDVNRLLLAIERGEMRLLRDQVPDGLAEARSRLTTLVDQVSRETGLPVSRFVLGGFSQGAMLATDVALRLPEAPAGLCIFSGTLLAEVEWRALAQRRGPLKVFQSHGDQDQVLPFVAAEWLRDLLIEAGMDVEYLPFHGGHQIPLEALERFAAMLSAALPTGEREEEGARIGG